MTKFDSLPDGDARLLICTGLSGLFSIFSRFIHEKHNIAKCRQIQVLFFLQHYSYDFNELTVRSEVLQMMLRFYSSKNSKEKIHKLKKVNLIYKDKQF